MIKDFVCDGEMVGKDPFQPESHLSEPWLVIGG